MGRLAAMFLAAFALAVGPVQARDACDGFRVEPFVETVPYFSGKMVAGGTTDQGLSFVHPDDARISVAFRLQAVGEQPQTTRADFTRDLYRRLSAEFPPKGDVVYNTSVNPYDPIAWTVQSRQAGGDDVVSRGTLTVRVAPTCHLVAAWSVVEAPVLATRIKEFNSALEALRTLAAKRMAPAGFLPDSTVPTGAGSFLFGVILPLMAAGVLFGSMRSMIFHGRGAASTRAIAAAAAACVVLGAFVQLPHYLEGFEEMRFMDNAALLAAVALSYVVAAATAEPKSLLWAFSVSLCASVVLAFGCALSWSPDRTVSAILAMALLVSGCAGLWVWQIQRSGAGRGRRAPSVAA